MPGPALPLVTVLAHRANGFLCLLFLLLSVFLAVSQAVSLPHLHDASDSAAVSSPEESSPFSSVFLHRTTRSGNKSRATVDCRQIFNPDGTRPTWHNWYGGTDAGITTTAPVLFPTSDEQLRNILTTAAQNGCKVRPTGSKHTDAGYVTTRDYEKETVVVSLARHRHGDLGGEKAWDFSLDTQGKKVRYGAGRSLLDLYQDIRPKGYFLPTVTDGVSFTVGGIIANAVHGGYHNRSFVSNHVTALRVMWANGTVGVLENSHEISFHRSGFGLPALITGVELEVVPRSFFCMQSNKRLVNSGFYNKKVFDEIVNRPKFGTESGDVYGEIFMAYDPVLESNSFRTINFRGGDTAKQCRPAGQTPVWYNSRYEEMQNRLGDIEVTGGEPQQVPFGLTAGENQYTQVAATSFMFTSIIGTGVYISNKNLGANDGLWLEQAPPGQFMEYWFPADKDFEVAEAWRAWVRKYNNFSNNAEKPFRVNGAAEWRYAQITNTDRNAALFQLSPGKYFAFNLLRVGDGLDGRWREPFLEIETILRNMGGVPAVTKLFCFGRGGDGRVGPFQRECMQGVFKEEQRVRFVDYLNKVDPQGLFRAGEALAFF